MKPRPAVVQLAVSDMAATLAFYRRLGVDIPPEADSEVHVEAHLDGGMHLAWDTEEIIRSFEPDWSPPAEASRRTRLGFAFDSPADVDGAWAEITAAGHQGHLAPWDAVWGMRYAVVHDPDGTPVDLFAPLPAAELAP